MLRKAAYLPVIALLILTAMATPALGATIEESGIRISKEVTPTAVCPGQEVTVTVTVQSTEQAAGVSVDVMIVLDRSLSMQGEKLQDAKNAAKHFVDLLNIPSDQVGLVSFADTATLDKGLSTDVAGVKTAIDSLTAGNLTAIGEAINKAKSAALGSGHRDGNLPTIVLLSDGQNTAGIDPQAPAEAAKSAGVRMISIGLGGGVDEAALASVATSESDYYFAPSSSDLANIYSKIAQSLAQTVTTNATLVDVVPTNASYIDGSASVPPTVGGNTLTWEIGTLKAGEPWVVSWRQSMSAAGLVDDLTSRFNFAGADRKVKSIALPQISVSAKADCGAAPTAAPPTLPVAQTPAQPVARGRPVAAQQQTTPPATKPPFTGDNLIAYAILAGGLLGGGLLLRRIFRKDGP